jgi:hypothetical protein
MLQMSSSVFYPLYLLFPGPTYSALGLVLTILLLLLLRQVVKFLKCTFVIFNFVSISSPVTVANCYNESDSLNAKFLE